MLTLFTMRSGRHLVVDKRPGTREGVGLVDVRVARRLLDGAAERDATVTCFRKIAMICFSLNLDRFINLFLAWGGLYRNLDEETGLRSSPRATPPSP